MINIMKARWLPHIPTCTLLPNQQSDYGITLNWLELFLKGLHGSPDGFGGGGPALIDLGQN